MWSDDQKNTRIVKNDLAPLLTMLITGGKYGSPAIPTRGGFFLMKPSPDPITILIANSIGSPHTHTSLLWISLRSAWRAQSTDDNLRWSPPLQPHYPHQHQWPQPPFPAGTLPTLMTHGKTNKNWLRLWSDRKLQNATAWNCFGRNIGRQRGEILVGETEWNILLLKSKKYSGTGENGWGKPLWNVCCIINQLEYNHTSICEKGKQFKNFIVYWECKMKLHYWMSWCGKCNCWEDFRKEQIHL